MDTTRKTRAPAIVMAGMVLISLGLCVSDASAQIRGRSVAAPRHSSGLKFPNVSRHSNRHQSNSSGLGLDGLNSLGNLLDSARQYSGNGGGYHGSDHHGYSDAEAYRDVGIANAVVGLVGTLLNANNYPPASVVEVTPVPPPYPVTIVPAPTVEVRPVLPPYPVTIVPAPRVIVEVPPYYGYAPNPYSYVQPNYYPQPYYNPPVCQDYAPGYRDEYDNHPRRPYGNGGNYREPGARHGGDRTPVYRGSDMQYSRPSRQGGNETHVTTRSSGARRGSQSTQLTPPHPSGRSYRVR